MTGYANMNDELERLRKAVKEKDEQIQQLVHRVEQLEVSGALQKETGERTCQLGLVLQFELTRFAQCHRPKMPFPMTSRFDSSIFHRN